MTQTPEHLQDAEQILSQSGFVTGQVWYHGTSSALVDSIVENGLKRSGDKAMKQAAKQTMATIGNSYTESIEPVFLTQSKELAYYWAQRTVRDRSVRFEGTEQPVVLAVDLPDEINTKVKPDVGAASLLMIEGENYLPFVAAIFERCGLEAPDIDLRNADRMDYLNLLGMAYLDQDVAPDHLQPIKS